MGWLIYSSLDSRQLIDLLPLASYFIISSRHHYHYHDQTISPIITIIIGPSLPVTFDSYLRSADIALSLQSIE